MLSASKIEEEIQCVLNEYILKSHNSHEPTKQTFSLIIQNDQVLFKEHIKWVFKKGDLFCGSIMNYSFGNMSLNDIKIQVVYRYNIHERYIKIIPVKNYKLNKE
jgi:hypothetical protein